MQSVPQFPASASLEQVRYDIRGPLAHRALELEREGRTIVKLNIGNPGTFGFRMPDHLRQAMVDNLVKADPYSHQKGIVSAREAVARSFHRKGLLDVTPEDVFLGNGVSELILFVLRALLNEGDEVLIPAPDYPLWTAAVTLASGRAVHYACEPEDAWVPDPDRVRSLITPRTRALVVISPNNPTGAVYPRPVLEALARVAEEHGLLLLSDEIYDEVTFEGAVHTPLATLAHGTLVGTFGGLSKVHRGCGIRAGWLTFTGAKSGARPLLDAIELLSSLRLCSNVPGQFAVAPALDGPRTIDSLTGPGGRLFESRRALIEGVAKSSYLHGTSPMGALYAFIGVRGIPDFDDHRFAFGLLEEKSVLVVPGRSFHFGRPDHFRTTILPEANVITEVLGRIDEYLHERSA